MYTLSLQIDLISWRRGSKAEEELRAHGINPRIIPFGATGLYLADRIRLRIHWRQTRERINMSLAHYLSNCLKLPRHYAKVRDSPVTPGGRKHVTLRITRDRKSITRWEKNNSETRLTDDIFVKFEGTCVFHFFLYDFFSVNY